jgi:hypothetical protein
MLSVLSKAAIAATTALIIGLTPIATADLAFARGMGGGGGGGGMRVGGGGGFGGGHFGGGFSGGHFGGGFSGGHFVGGMGGVSHFSGSMVGSRFSGAQFVGGARLAHSDFDRGFHRGFRHRRFVALGGFEAGYDGYCDDPYDYPYPPYGRYGYNYCY